MWMIIGVGFYSMTLGEITALIINLDKETGLLKKIETQVEEITRICDVPY